MHAPPVCPFLLEALFLYIAHPPPCPHLPPSLPPARYVHCNTGTNSSRRVRIPWEKSHIVAHWFWHFGHSRLPFLLKRPASIILHWPPCVSRVSGCYCTVPARFGVGLESHSLLPSTCAPTSSALDSVAACFSIGSKWFMLPSAELGPLGAEVDSPTPVVSIYYVKTRRLVSIV